MSGRPEASGVEYLARFLVSYRILFYLGGLLAMSVPLLAAWVFDVVLSSAARTTIVTVSFGVLLVTYLAERRVGLDHVDPATGAPLEPYSRRLRASVVLAIVGVAVGVYLVLDGAPAAGVLFLAGALLFFQLAYRAERRGDDAAE